MISIDQIQQMARDAALEAFANNQEPVCLGSGQFHPPFPIPFIGSLVEQFDLPYEEVETFFVDASGFGREGEPALTHQQFSKRASDLVATTREPLYWGVIEAGQFQVYVRAYRRTDGEG